MGLGQTVDVTTAQDEASSEDGDAWYRDRGFALVASGALCGLIGISAVLFAQQAGGMQRYVYREIAGTALGLALVLFLAGSSFSLPLGTVSRILAISGATLGTAGVAAFVWLYPTHWNVLGRDYSAIPISVYGTGLAFSVAAVTNGLLAAYLEWRGATRAATESDDGEGVTDEEVMRDILETTSRQRLTWGGIRTDDRDIELATLSEAAVELSGNTHRIGDASTLEDGDVTPDVDRLLAFRGVQKTESEDYDHGPAQALARLRQTQPIQTKPGWLDRLRTWWSGA